MTDFIWFIHVCCGAMTGTSIAVILYATGALDIIIDRIEDFFEYRRLKKRYRSTVRTGVSSPTESLTAQCLQEKCSGSKQVNYGAWNYVSIAALSAAIEDKERRFVAERQRKEEQRKAKIRQFFRRIFTLG